MQIDKFRFGVGITMTSLDVVFEVNGFPVTYVTLILIFTWMLFLWDNYLNCRQIKLAKNTSQAPEDIKSVIEEETFSKSRLYAVDKLKYEVVSGTYSIVFLSLVLHYQLMSWLWKKVEDHLLLIDSLFSERFNWPIGVNRDSEILFSLGFTVYASVFQFFDSLPWSYYRNFVLEDRYGFNKQTVGFWIKDKIKGLVVSLSLGMPILTGMLWIIKAGGEFFYLYVYVFTFVVSIVIMFIYPEFIAPLFDRYERFPDCELRTKIEDLAAQIKFPLKKLFVVEGSKRSAHSNAYFYGFGSNKRIVLFDTLIKGFKMPGKAEKDEDENLIDDSKSRGCGDDEEILAVLAHELGHWKLNHFFVNLLIAQANLFFMFFVFGQLVNVDKLFVGFGFPSTTAPMLIRLIVVFQFVFMPYSSVLEFLMTILSRKLEFQADEFAVSLKPGEKLKRALLVLTLDNLSFPIYDHLYSLFNLSHPPILERMKAIDEAEKKKKKD